MNLVVALETVDDLRAFVLHTLCAHDQLDPKQTPMFEGLVTRSGKPCGLFFHVQGPRLLKAYALWAGDDDRIFFYDSTGARYAQARLSEAPDPSRLAA